VSAEILKRRRARGERPIGRKIGFTNRLIWDEYRVSSPMWGHVYDHTVIWLDEPVARLAIGHLSDLMQGAGSFKTPWPVQPTQLPRDDRVALQKKLAALGYDQTRFSAHIDFKMRDFVRAEQKKHGLVTDGQPNAALMDKMGVKRQQP